MKTQLRFRMPTIALATLTLLGAILLPANLLAQIDRGEITGTVEDPTGAVVQNAKIVLINTQTNVTASTRSTQTGTYSFEDLLPGEYTIQADAPGFKKYIVHGIYVHVQQVQTLDVHFATGSDQQNVTVTAAAPLLKAENAEVGQTITNQEVNYLPLATRDWGSLAQMSAGVAAAAPGGVTADAGSSNSAYFSVNGANVWQNDFRLDGINDNIEFYGGNYTLTNAAIVPPPDAVEEFTLQSGDFSAELGHSTGGIVNAAIKSGTKQLHGDIWEYVRNNDLNANYYFNTANGVAKPIPEYHQNLFGITAGGPVLIPHLIHGNAKTFWFFDYQGGRYVLPEPAGGETVPTLGMINSGFTNLQDNIVGNESSTCSPTNTSKCPTDALGRTFLNGTIFDPATTRQIPATGIDPISGLPGAVGSYVRDPFYGCTATGCPAANYGPAGPLTGVTSFTNTSALNIIPTSRLDPNAVKLLGVYPAPQTTTVTAGSGLVNNFASYVPLEYKNTNTWDIRIDETINDKNTLFGVFDRSLFAVVVPSNFPGVAVGETGGRNDSLPAYAWAVGYTRIFTPTFTNDMHVGMVHSDKLQQSFYGNTFGIPAQYGIQGIQQVANNGGLPPTTIAGLTHIGVGNYTPTLQYVWSIEGVDGITKVYRSHVFKAGIQIDDLEGNISQPPQGRGDLNFNGMYTDIPNRISVTGSGLNGIGDLLVTPVASNVSGGVADVGGMNGFSASNIAATDDHRWYWGAYGQDDWKLNPKLTLNLGVRWDYFTPYAETRGYQANFIPVGGNGSTGTYYMPNSGCNVPRSTTFNQALAASNIALDCTSSLTLGSAQKTNFAPRVGFAFRATPTLVVRGGFGTEYGALGNLGYGGTLGTNYPFVYTQTFPAPDSNHPLLIGSPAQPATMEYTFTQFNFQNPTVVQGVTPATPLYLGLSLYGRQYNFQTPLIQTENLTVQNTFTPHDSIQISYVGSQGRHLDNLGYNNGNTQILPPGANSQNYIPFPDFARNATYETTNAASSYNSLQITYEHQLSAGLYLLANYSWSKCMNDQHTQASENQQYRAEWLPNFGITADYALCDSDATNIVHIAGSYNLPFGNGRAFMSHANWVANTFLGGWIVNGFYTYQSGQPFTVSCPTATTADFGCFADVVQGQGLYTGGHTVAQWLNPNAFAEPPVATTIGQSNYAPLGGGQMQARGPDFANLDASILKEFPIKESIHFEFRAEVFNATNTPPFAQPTSQLNFETAKFSNISSTKNSNENFGARTLQLALKLFY
jgi:Carboxypeptidase regulatory-like domain/TonB dependent receptor